MTNGHCNYIFKEHVLTQQSQWEADRPVKPILMRLFEGIIIKNISENVSFFQYLDYIKKINCLIKVIFPTGKTIVCCRTAWDDFEKIVNTLGGPKEIERTAELKQMLTIYPDDYAGW